MSETDNTLASHKLDMQSPDLVSQNFEKLAELFPNCVTESATGKAIDFDLLKQELNHAVVEGNKERYRLEWPGKREAIVTANLPTTKTLRPVREDSVDFDNTENIYIEGDNLEVLKLLQESYLGKIKMIYIDPPYNTGNDFVYRDNFSRNTDEELFESGQKDEFNQRLVKNPETSGKYHSDWLSMMYPRLKLARNLLSDDGVIFISIDDNEQANLKRICDEIFGEVNFLTCIAVKLSESTGVKMAHAKQRIPKLKEYVLLYKKSKTVNINPAMISKDKWDSEYRTVCLGLTKIELEYIKDVILDESRNQEDLSNLQNLLNKVSFHAASAVCKEETGKDISNEWLFSNAYRIVQFVTMTGGGLTLARTKKDSFKTLPPAFYIVSPMKKAYLIKSDFNHESDLPRCKILFADQYLQVNSGDFWVDIKTTGLDNEGEVEFKNGKKPLKLVKRCIDLVSNDGDIILDFFSGSATTAHSIMQLNAEEGFSRKFILVQIPETTDEKSEAFKSGFKSIVEIGKERIRRAAKRIKDETNADIDYGFRVYRLDDSNMQDVYYRSQELDQTKMDMFDDNVKLDRTEDDLLAQVMLDWGLPLSLKIEQANVSGKNVFKVAENSLFACFDKGIDEAFAKEIAKEKPLRIVFKDAGFKDDTAKTNVKQLLKQLSPETEMKVL